MSRTYSVATDFGSGNLVDFRFFVRRDRAGEDTADGWHPNLHLSTAVSFGSEKAAGTPNRVASGVRCRRRRMDRRHSKDYGL
jgi:hypothetical protein